MSKWHFYDVGILKLVQFTYMTMLHETIYLSTAQMPQEKLAVCQSCITYSKFRIFAAPKHRILPKFLPFVPGLLP